MVGFAAPCAAEPRVSGGGHFRTVHLYQSASPSRDRGLERVARGMGGCEGSRNGSLPGRSGPSTQDRDMTWAGNVLCRLRSQTAHQLHRGGFVKTVMKVSILAAA